MHCPKCEEGTINKILFKKNNQSGFLCDFCGAVWPEGEEINAHTGYMISSLTKDDGMEYTFVDANEHGQDSKSVLYPKDK